MHIEKELLLTCGGKLKTFHKNELIFTEGQEARFFFQIAEGAVRMYNVNDSAGKEFTQGMFSNDCSFGDAALVIGETYPANAIALQDTAIIMVPRENFIQLLHDHSEIHFRFTQLMAYRLWDKYMTFKELMSNTPTTRILGFLKSLKKKYRSNDEKILIPYTRQEIADFTGLRVETAIRTLNKLKKENVVEIINRKLYY